MSDDIRISKQGIDVLGTAGTVPNNLIFHSSYNTFKILAEGTTNISYTADGTYAFNHGANITAPTSFMCFYKFPDGYTTIGNGTFGNCSRDYVWFVNSTTLGTAQINQQIYGSGTASTIGVSYYIFETPLS